MEDRLGPIPSTPRRLCRLDDLTSPGSAGFIVETADGAIEVMVIRQGARAFAYVNLCPHWGAPLDMTPGQFLDRDRQHILCANHGAVFRIEDGFCLKGPCRGASLQAVWCAVAGDDVVLTGSASVA
jgi:nitrite reductase/ring-hydroxylating ferredoxin subunit